MEDIVKRVVENKRYIAIATRIFLTTQIYLEGLNAYIASDTLKPDYVSMIFQKRSPLRKPFNLM